MYQFFDHCDLDIVSRIITSGAYLIYYLREESQIKNSLVLSISSILFELGIWRLVAS